MLYTAARIGVEGFIRMVFGTSAGRIVFEAYKNKSPLPEEIAAGNGYDEIASFLRNVSERYFCVFQGYVLSMVMARGRGGGTKLNYSNRQTKHD